MKMKRARVMVVLVTIMLAALQAQAVVLNLNPTADVKMLQGDANNYGRDIGLSALNDWGQQ